MPASIPVAQCLASINKLRPDGTWITAMLLSDLRHEYPVAGEKRGSLSPTQVYSSVDWLSDFHGFWWAKVNDFEKSTLVRPPLEEVRGDGQNASKKTVWLNGGYTYLATRRKEYATLASDKEDEWSRLLTSRIDDEGRSIAEVVADFLTPKFSSQTSTEAYQTLLHGDVKSENLFTSESGEKVAFYDFQYVGLGLGVCDLAKFFTCSVPLEMLVPDHQIPHELEMQHGEKELLERYWTRLRKTSNKEYDWATLVLHWEIALVDWLRFQASWGFWGNTEWLEARVRSIVKDEDWREAVAKNVGTSSVPDASG